MSEIVKLKDIGTIITGRTPKTKISNFWDSNDVPFVKPSDFKQSINNLDSYNTYLSNDGFSNANKIPKNSVLVTCIGTIGKVAINDIEVATNQQINSIIPNENIDAKYLMYQISTKKQYLNHIANAPIVPIINKTTFSNIDIFVPSLTKQKQIAKTLDKAQELIELRKESIEKLDALAKSIFIDIFGNPVSNPMKWKAINFKSILNTIDGGWSPVCNNYPRNNNNYGILKLSALSNDIYHSSENKKMLDNTQPKMNTLVSDGDLLFSRKNTYMLVGSCAYVWNTEDNLFMPDLIFRLNTNNKVNKVFLWKYLTNDEVKIQLRNIANGAAASMPNISKAKLLNFRILLPPMIKQESFAQKIQKIEQQKSFYQEELTKLQENFDALLAQSFKG